LIGKAVEVDMAFTRGRSIVRMLVTRPEFIPKTTVDHVFDGEGYGLLFKAKNGNGNVDDDTDMDEAPLDDKNKKHDVVKANDGGKVLRVNLIIIHLLRRRHRIRSSYPGQTCCIVTRFDVVRYSRLFTFF
jgi:hypothetical protein